MPVGRGGEAVDLAVSGLAHSPASRAPGGGSAATGASHHAVTSNRPLPYICRIELKPIGPDNPAPSLRTQQTVTRHDRPRYFAPATTSVFAGGIHFCTSVMSGVG